jgi:hypothetical protein
LESLFARKKYAFFTFSYDEERKVHPRNLVHTQLEMHVIYDDNQHFVVTVEGIAGNLDNASDVCQRIYNEIF